MKKRITHDFESRSFLNLRSVGAYKYSMHPSTRPTCFSFKKHGEDKIYFLDFYEIMKPWKDHPVKLRSLWKSWIAEGYEFSAHNSYFEKCIYVNILVKRLGWPKIPSKKRRCTAAKAAACSLPRNLEGAGFAMNLRTQKDKRGFAAMMATCKPTKKYNDWIRMRAAVLSRRRENKKLTPKQQKWIDDKKHEPPIFLEPDNDPQGVFPVLYHYCKIDTKAEEELDDALPDLIPQEQEVWQLNQLINWRGLHIDISATKKIVGIMAIESKIGLEELDTLTMGLITKAGAIKSILEFLEAEGVELPNLRAKTVDGAIRDEKTPSDLKRLLELRKSLSRTSTKKYQSFLDRADDDDHLRDILMYHGAGTGRDTGKGAQFHNLPRGLIKVEHSRPYRAIEDVIDCTSDELKILYGKNLSILFSSILRNMIIPTKGCEMFVADFSMIEVAVCWWLADNIPGLKILRAGKDPYKYMAAENTGKKYEDIEDDGDDRRLGKAQILGAQFGMGGVRFQLAAWDMHNLKLSDTQSKSAINTYRQKNAAVPRLWKSYEQAAIQAIKNKSKVKAGKCVFIYANKFLWIELPSGRRLAYRSPQIVMRDTDYGPRESIEFWGAKGKHWRLERTWGGTLTENIVQAVARDLMMYGNVRLEKAGYRALLSVHDEAVNERKKGEGSLEEFIEILCELPEWAKGLPIKAKGWKGERYRK